MKIAMIGHKQFPSRSGGVEVVVYELATRLARCGEDITVYDRGKVRGKNRYICEGVKVRRSFTFKQQSLNAMVYSFTATFDALFRGYDIIHYHAIGPSVPLFIAHAFGKKTVAAIHGLNWRVDKWNSFASRYLKLGERIAAKYADEVVTLSADMHKYFLDTYGRETTLIENGVTPIPMRDDDAVRECLGVGKGEYYLYVGRISPEKGIHDLVRAYKVARPTKKLVIAGEIPDNDFGREIRELVQDEPNIICAGFVTGELLYSLYCNCATYILPSHTEGLPLTLLEAMSCGADCLVSDIPENTSVLAHFGRAFKVSDIAALASELGRVQNERDESEKKRQAEHVSERYGYERVIDEHMKLYRRVMEK